MDFLVGLGACAITALCFGSMYVPVRMYETGDGMFVHWLVCLGIFLAGMIMNASMGFPQIQPLAMIGGCLIACANVVAMPIFKHLGLGMGNLLWGAINCVVGWATGQFGLLGIHANPSPNSLLNYSGVVCVLLGGFLFSAVKPSVEACSAKVKDGKLEAIGDQKTNGSKLKEAELVSQMEEDTSGSQKKRIVAVMVALAAGLCYGVQIVPVIYIQENLQQFKNPEKGAIKYAFSHYCGILMTSNAFFICYLLCKRNKPFVNKEIILPSLLAGMIWAVGQLAWFLANDLLSQAISFPINAMMPGVCAALWSIFYFKEIKGRSNFVVLSVAILVTSLGATLVGLSKIF